MGRSYCKSSLLIITSDSSRPAAVYSIAAFHRRGSQEIPIVNLDDEKKKSGLLNVIDLDLMHLPARQRTELGPIFHLAQVCRESYLSIDTSTPIVSIRVKSAKR